MKVELDYPIECKSFPQIILWWKDLNTLEAIDLSNWKVRAVLDDSLDSFSIWDDTLSSVFWY